MRYVEIFNDINEKTLADVKSALESSEKEICLLINSLGGSLPIGLEIFDMLSTCPKDRHTLYAKCRGNVASSATLILCGVPLENRTATRNTCFLIHNPLVSFYGTQNLSEIKALTTSMESANEQIKAVYRLRTLMNDELMDSLMSKETEFYADKAKEYGLIGTVEQLQNKRSIYNKQKRNNTMKKSFLTMLTNKIVKALLYNEVYTAEDGTNLEIDVLEVGGKCDKDGIFVVDGYTITVEGGVITDIIAPQEEVVENEGEDKTQEEKVEEVAETVQEVVEQTVEQTVEEDGEVDATEVGKVVKEIVEESLKEFDELKELVEKCGGKDKLKALCNVKHSAKVFNAVEKKDNKKYTIKELVEMKRNRK